MTEKIKKPVNELSKINPNLHRGVWWSFELAQCYEYPTRRSWHNATKGKTDQEILRMLLDWSEDLYIGVEVEKYADPNEEEKPFTRPDQLD